MESEEKQISYTTSNSYSTLNKLTKNTKNVWIVFHGIGYLSKFFIRYFNELPPEENYIIAPQAPSKYYLKKDYKYVGACWLTKQNRILETENLLRYLDQLFAKEKIKNHHNIIILGFSQGVSIATRWAAKSKINFKQLILYAGGIPEELTPNTFNFLSLKEAKVKIIIGNQDEYITANRLTKEQEKANLLFNGNAEWITFEGGHEIKKEIINQLLP